MEDHLSPQEKKQQDYKRQRRFHHNNDKSARKWIPARKARLKRELRRKSNEIISTALATNSEIDLVEDAASNEQLRKLVPHDYFSKDRSETLGEHVAHQLEDRRRKRATSVSHIPSSEYDFAQPYVRERDYKPFVTFMRLSLRKSTKTTEGTRNFARLIERCVQEDWPFFHGFFADEPTWRPRLLKWAERVLRVATKNT